jgi:hypothetical protein
MLPGKKTAFRSGDSIVCFNIIKNCPMLDLPELLAPKNKVMGAMVMVPVSFQPLKF